MIWSSLCSFFVFRVYNELNLATILGKTLLLLMLVSMRLRKISRKYANHVHKCKGSTSNGLQERNRDVINLIHCGKTQLANRPCISASDLEV